MKLGVSGHNDRTPYCHSQSWDGTAEGPLTRVSSLLLIYSSITHLCSSVVLWFACKVFAWLLSRLSLFIVVVIPGTCSIILTEISPITGWLAPWFPSVVMGWWKYRCRGLAFKEGGALFSKSDRVMRSNPLVQAPTLTEHTGNERVTSLGQTL